MKNWSEFIQKILSTPSENEVLEFKKAENDFDFDKLGKYFSALSNEANLRDKESGFLILGVDDKFDRIKCTRNITGTRYRNNDNLHKLKHEITDNTTNRIGFKEITEETIETKRLIIFEIPPAPKGIPIAWKGHYYARNGESLAALHPEKQKVIFNQNTENDWSRIICHDATIENLDEDAILKARIEFIKKNPRTKPEEIKNWDNLTFLKKARIINPKGQITNTAIILLGKPESEYFLGGGVARIRWILKDAKNIEMDHEHFGPPLILNVDKILAKIRNLRFRHLPDGTLFPLEIDTYDNYVMREALHNCIAHQDYNMKEVINFIETPDRLIFSNAGSFIPITIENVTDSDAPASHYRNSFLATTMLNLNMIDIAGSGIKKMFNTQKERFFPLPDYQLEDNRVKVTIFGKIIDQNYTNLLINNPDLKLEDVILLNKVQTKKPTTLEESSYLKKKGLVEGRYPNIYVASHISKITGTKAKYIKNKAFDDKYYKDLILSFLVKNQTASRKEIDDLLIDKLSDILNQQQKIYKINYILSSMVKTNDIYCVRKGGSSRWFLRNKN